MIAVVDTSAVIRLFIPDGPLPPGLDDFFRDLEKGKHTAIAPELMLVEAANVLHKKTQRDEIDHNEALEILALIQRLPIRIFPHKTLLEGSLQIANTHQLSVYDALFLELALQKADRLFTADNELKKISSALMTL